MNEFDGDAEFLVLLLVVVILSLTVLVFYIDWKNRARVK